MIESDPKYFKKYTATLVLIAVASMQHPETIYKISRELSRLTSSKSKN